MDMSAKVYHCNDCKQNAKMDPLRMELRGGCVVFRCPACDATYREGQGNLPTVIRDAPLIAIVDGKPTMIEYRDGALYANHGHGVFLPHEATRLDTFKAGWNGQKHTGEDHNPSERNLRFEYGRWLAETGRLTELTEAPHGGSHTQTDDDPLL